MKNNEGEGFPDILAKTISAVFHPLFMPLYGMLIIFSAPTLLGYLPFEVKKMILLVVFINNILLPLMLLPIFRYRNIISSWTIDEQTERIIPLSVTTLLYLATTILIFRFPIPLFLKSFVLAAFIISLLITIISFRWKISIHAIGAGALIALVLILSLKLGSSLTSYLIPVIIVAGMVMSSRLKLNAHNPAQVWYGFLTGSLGLSLFMVFI
jgi:membrane-associated phospholipid phosphatase